MKRKPPSTNSQDITKYLRPLKENKSNSQSTKKTVLTPQSRKTMNREPTKKQVCYEQLPILRSRQMTSLKTRKQNQKDCSPEGELSVGEDCSDPYNFDSFIEEYEKENLASSKVKKGRKAAPKQSEGPKRKKKRRTPKLKEGKVVTKKTKESSDRCGSSRKKLIDMEDGSEVEILRRESTILQPAHAERSSLCNEQVFPSFNETTKAGELVCCTSTPQNTENNLFVSFTDKAVLSNTLDNFENVSPVGTGPSEHEDDLNCSGFVAEGNFRSYKRCRTTVNRKGANQEQTALAETKVVHKRKRKGKSFEKKFDKWVSTTNDSLLEAEDFELFIE